MSTIFVTGGTGGIGRHVIPLLIQRGDRVRALARSDAAAAELASNGAEIIRGDVRDAAVVARGAAGADAVVHAAAVVVSSGDWTAFESTNVAPTRLIARAAADAGARLIHISSVAVYGRLTTFAGGVRSVTEDFGLEQPMVRGDHYARSKREAELAVWDVAAATGLKAVALRPCVVYGEGDRQFAPRVAKGLRFGRAPLIGDGSNPLSVVYAGNVAAAVRAALDRPEATGPFNVANDGAVATREFFEAFAAGLGVELELVEIPWDVAWPLAKAADTVLKLVRRGAPLTTLKYAVQFLGSPNPYVSDRARRELGWQPALDPREAAFRTGRWFRPRGT